MSIAIVGMGMGTAGTLTADARRAIDGADVLIGAGRLLDALPDSGAPSRHAAVAAGDILALIERNRGENICVLMSGDVGFYSGARALAEKLPADGLELFPGISSVQYFAARLRRPWQDWKLVSAHGVPCDAAGIVRDHRETFFLTGGALTVEAICQALCSTGLGHVTVTAGENLGSGTERITSGTAEALARRRHEPLAVLLAENPDPRRHVSCGYPDDAFIRGDIPMTKSEVRSVVLSKLRLRGGDIVYDVGAGTGSVSVEAALLAGNGHVYAFERESEGCRLIGENAKKFGVSNVTALAGEAPASFDGLPVPDAAFVGGSGGGLEDILRRLLALNPAIRLVVSAIALETVNEATALFGSLPLRDAEIVQISVSRAKLLGAHHLMLGQNPVFIFSGTGSPSPT
ncbi:precorrin-6Y C5,15-methyltransferase (decarboxylating) [Sporobacter termitidis DSM 10068]|uniref:Precorrin-6Y C5,15-methyltransferase (Decarboxylating) n=1 Tax=Sporobacter termitidis DSM 10068 TaxID=1123282 RepID=A0A1M5XJP3_9FIRM|nr:bifunctional cobalt-precorrin-7 (C(5))-methyltransferase/cobalt-precorrin-6B (C(15))-methyltransferase [Sporobacter termitidis]SHI00030.1 precorrin-6Y C5,15-methyltransferase (decarboxylating) [Sporobacter termitidis DSM 10068]